MSFERRTWLNDPKSETAFISGYVEEASEGGYVTATLKIADCDRVVTLDFDSSGDTDRGAVRHKLRRFRQHMAAFTKAVEAEMDAAEENEGGAS